MRHPFLVDLDEPADAFDQLRAVERRQARPLRRQVHPLHIQFWPEQPNLVIHTPVRFHPFKQLNKRTLNKLS